MAKNVYQGAPNSGDDWSTLAGALTAAGDGETITISGSWTIADTAPATVANNNITIQTDPDSRHNGYVDNSENHYRLEVSSNNHAITVTGTGCTVDGLVIKIANFGVSYEGIRVSATDARIENCIIWAGQSATDQDGIYLGTAGLTVTAENNIIYGFHRGGVHLQANGCTLNVNSCTLYVVGDSSNGGNVINNGNTNDINVFNTLALLPAGHDGNAFDFKERGSGTAWDIDNCISSDSSISARDSGAVGALENRTDTDSATPGAGDWVMFNDVTDLQSYDLRLQDDAANNDAQDAHSNASGAGLSMPAVDIVGTSRAAPYEIGVYSLGNGEPSPMPVTRLDAALGTMDNDPNYTVSAGSLRMLLFAVSQESGAPTQPNVTWGGQTMTHIAGQLVGTSTILRTDVFYLDETGIGNASGNSFNISGGSINFTYHAASYAGVKQEAPVEGDRWSQNDSSPTVLSPTSTTDGAVVCFAASGATGSVTWTGGVIEQTEVSGNSQCGTIADELITAGGPETYTATWVGANRTNGHAIILNADAAGPGPGPSIAPLAMHHQRQQR